MKAILKALLVTALAIPAVAKDPKPGSQVWSRTEGNIEHRLTIVAKPHSSGCCAIEGRMQIIENGKVIHDLELERQQFGTWWDEGVPVSITIVSDSAGVSDESYNILLTDMDTMVLYAPWFPNRNHIYHRVK